MIVNLDKKDLIALVKGSTPGYSTMSHPLVSKNGTYYDQYGRYEWDRYKLAEMTEEQLLDLYYICKNK